MLTRAAARLFSTDTLKVVHNVAKQQFIVSRSGLDAVLGYEQIGKTIKFLSTDVPPVFQGKGIGRLLAKHAFDYAYEQNLHVICECHFLAKYYKNNINKYKDLKIEFDLKD